MQCAKNTGICPGPVISEQRWNQERNPLLPGEADS